MNFSKLPSISINRAKFKRNSTHKTTMNLGEITPIYLDEVLPGDTRKIDMGALIRMNTPVAPFLDDVFMDIYAFFVPNRLTWSHWKEFMGENNSSAGIYSGTEYTIPKTIIATMSVGRLGDYFGLPTGLAYEADKAISVSALPARGYRLIYNRWFRDQNLIAPVPVNLGDTTTANDSYNINLFKAAKVSDYFTRALPYVQKGAPVSIPLGVSAPIKFDTSMTGGGMIGYTFDADYSAEQTAEKLDGDSISVLTANTGGVMLNDDDDKGIIYDNSSQLYVDLSKATAATINQLRFAFQYQKLLEKDALYGSRYWELLKAHFSVIAPDASLQDPQYLGHMRVNLRVDQVLQTTGTNQATPSSNTLGATGAVSVTAKAGNLLTFSATEHGYIHIYAVARHKQTYGQGIDRHFSRSTRTDFYFPVFANLGAQAILNKEIYAQGVEATDNEPFGYQEAWAEYRYKSSKVTGLLNPSVANSLGYWTLANNFGELPTLGQTFIEQGRSNLSRVLSTGLTGPDFICDFAFQDISVRPMPLYSVPGLIDHH